MRALPDPVLLAEAIRSGDRAVLARAITLVESTRPEHRAVARQLVQLLLPETGRAIRIGITGVPGAGKSTTIDTFGSNLTAAGHRVAVLAVDPSSSRTGGSILGDKTRMARLVNDDRAYVRPSPSSGTLGGVAAKTRETMLLCEAAGFDVIIVETVGVGQSETEIADCADLVVFCAQPGSGDALQFMKAGVMETPDVVLVTKGDLGAPAMRAAADVKGALSLAAGDGPPPEVAIVSAATGEGIDAALGVIATRVAAARASGALVLRRRIQGRAWAESRLAESFGAVGVAALGARLAASDSPFSTLARLDESARTAVYDILKDI